MEPLALVDDLEPIDPLDQDRRMRAVLISMQCLMYGNTSRFDQNSGRQKPSGGHCPPGESTPLHMIWQHAYVLAAPEDRETVIANATDALIAARKRTTPIPAGETLEEWEARLINEGEGAEPRWVAATFNTSTKLVVRLRVKYERAPHDGTRLDTQHNARELATRGMTARQIALVLGCSPGTAQYHVNRARKAA